MNYVNSPLVTQNTDKNDVFLQFELKLSKNQLNYSFKQKKNEGRVGLVKWMKTMEVLNENGEIKKIKRLAVKERGYRENKLSGRTKGRILLAHLTPTDCPLTRCEQSRIFPCWMLRAIPFSFFFRVRISSSTEKEIRTTRARHLRRRGFFFCFFFHIRFT